MAQAHRSLSEWKSDSKAKFGAMLEASAKLASAEFGMKPIELSKLANDAIKRYTKIEDLYVDRKAKLNENAMKIVSDVVAASKSSNDPLKFLLKSAILGNNLDLGINEVDVDSKIVEKIEKTDLALDDFNLFMEKLEKARSILYILDNTGEVVFDKAFVDLIKERFHPNLKVAVRSAPIINDVTKKEALEVGFKEDDIIESGSTMAGMTLDVASEEFIKAWKNADLIISKGQGNFEGLEEIEDERLFFLLVAKCRIISEMLNVTIGEMVLKNSKGSDNMS